MEKFWKMAKDVKAQRKEVGDAFLALHFFQSKCSDDYYRLETELDKCAREYKIIARQSLKRESPPYTHSHRPKQRRMYKIERKMKKMGHERYFASVHLDDGRGISLPSGYLRLKNDYYHKRKTLYRLETESFDYIFNLAMIPVCFRPLTKLSVKHDERTVHFYLNYPMDKLGLEHGHIVMDEKGRFIYVRWPNEPRGARNLIEPVFPAEYFKTLPRS